MRPLFVGCAVTIAVVTHAAAQVPQDPNDQAVRVSTPLTVDGKPDFTGLWTGGGGGVNLLDIDEKGNITFLFKPRGGTFENLERDSGLRTRMSPNLPLYKPEFWERVQYMDHNGNVEDPEFNCLPAGVPRMGPPSQIVQTPSQMVFLYLARNTFRVIYTDDRPHTPVEELDSTWRGESIGHWEGDTLVIDTIGFNESSWLGFSGYFHSYDLHVVERMRREGNTITWQATVEDPVVLMKPWVMDSRTIRLNPDPKATLAEDLPCSERDLRRMVTKERG